MNNGLQSALLCSHVLTVYMYVQCLSVNKGQMLAGMFCEQIPTSLADISICQRQRCKLQKAKEDVQFVIAYFYYSKKINFGERKVNSSHLYTKLEILSHHCSRGYKAA